MRFPLRRSCRRASTSNELPANPFAVLTSCPLRIAEALVVAALGAGITGCSGDGGGKSTAAATVDGVAISQAVLLGALPSSDLAQRKAQLESVIAEQVLANAATKGKLEADAGVRSAMETARRQILARAYLAKQAAAQAKVTEEDIKAFYDQHPELFSERKVYRLQEIAITVAGNRIADISKKFEGMKTFGERAAWLTKNDIPFTTGVLVKGAEDWPADLLASLTKMKDGTAFDLPNTKGFSMLQLTGVEAQPVTLAQAQGQIARFIGNQRMGELVNRETKRLREAARVEYFAPYDAK